MKRGDKFAVAGVVFSALLSQASYAQQFPETERQKAEVIRERAQAAHKKAQQQATDEAYKAMIDQTPNTSKKIDPWGSLRTPPAKSGK